MPDADGKVMQAELHAQGTECCITVILKVMAIIQIFLDWNGDYCSFPELGGN